MSFEVQETITVPFDIGFTFFQVLGIIPLLSEIESQFLLDRNMQGPQLGCIDGVHKFEDNSSSVMVSRSPRSII